MGPNHRQKQYVYIMVVASNRRFPTVTVLFLSLCGILCDHQASAFPRRRTFTFFQDPPTFAYGPTVGNSTVYHYVATLRNTEGGPAVGTLFGLVSYASSLYQNSVSRYLGAEARVDGLHSHTYITKNYQPSFKLCIVPLPSWL